MTETEVEEVATERTKVGFPEAPVEEPRKFNFLALAIVLIVLLLIAGGVWYMFFKSPGSDVALEEEVTVAPTMEVTSTPVPTEAAVSRAEIKVQILNGSGVPGAAGKAQTALTALGYSSIEVGNADSYTYKSTVAAFDASVPENVKQEVISELQKLYGQVDSKPSTSTKYNIVITVGYPKGYSPSVTSKPATGAVSVTPTVTGASGTLTPTKNPSATLTPTR